MKLITANKLKRLWNNGIVPKLLEKLDKTRVLTSKEQVQANTNAENVVGALVAKELINDLGGLSFYEDSNGNKYVVGADSVPKKLGSGKFAYVTRTTTGKNSYTTTFERPNNASSVFFIIFAYTTLSNVVLSSGNGKMEFVGKYGKNIHLYNITDLTGDFTISYCVEGTGINTFYTIYSE